MLYSVQYLRALAAWLVVFHHFVQILLGFHQVSNGVERFFAQYGSLGVDLFFVISGFIITVSVAKKKESCLVFIKRRLLRIVPAYWFYTLLTLVLVLFIDGFFKYSAVDIEFVLKSLLFIPVENPRDIGLFPLLTVGWTLNYELYFYALFALTLAVFVKLEWRLVSIFAVMFVIANTVSTFGVGRFYASTLVYEFVLGTLVGYFYLKELLKFNTLVSCSMILVSILYIYIRAGGHHYLHTGIPMAILLAGSIALERFAKEGIVSRLGDYSYSTYLSHAIVLHFCNLFLLEYMGNPYILLIVAVSIIVFLSWLTYSVLEKRLYFNLRARGLI